MGPIQFIVAFGVSAGLLAVLIAALFQRHSSRKDAPPGRPFVPRTPGAMIGAFAGPGAAVSSLGQNGRVHQTLGTMIMRPTMGARVFNLALLGLMLFFMFGPAGAQYRNDPVMVGLVASACFVVGLYLTLYEVSYDDEGIMAPTWFYRKRRMEWQDLISIRDDGHHLYKLRFETGTIRINKYLVGMPTFLTFVTEVHEMNKRR